MHFPRRVWYKYPTDFSRNRCSTDPSGGPVPLYICLMQSWERGARSWLDFMLACCSGLSKTGWMFVLTFDLESSSETLQFNFKSSRVLMWGSPMDFVLSIKDFELAGFDSWLEFFVEIWNKIQYQIWASKIVQEQKYFRSKNTWDWKNLRIFFNGASNTGFGTNIWFGLTIVCNSIIDT